MKTIIGIALTILATASARPGFVHTVPSVLVPISHQYHSQDILGQYSYGYAAPWSARSEVRSVDGSTSGGYSYVDPNGNVQSVHYTADAVHGFRVAGTNIPVDKPVEVKPVEDTPEVAKAKEEHLKAVEEIKARDASIPEKSDEQSSDEESVEVGKTTTSVSAVHHLTPGYFYSHPYYTQLINYYSYPYVAHTYPVYTPTFYHQHGYVLPHVYSAGHKASDLPADDAAVAKATEEHLAAHKEVKEKLAAAGAEVN